MADPVSFMTRLARAKQAIETSGVKRALVIHHDEADGLCSASLAKLALEKLGLQTSTICLDKLYPEIVGDVESGPRKVIVYADLGSAHVERLGRDNLSRSILVALDHHDTRETADPLVHNLNPELDSFSGEKDASSATVAYLFAKIVEPELAAYSHLAFIGSKEIPGEIQGLNKIPLQDAEKEKVLLKTGKGFKLNAKGISLSPDRAATALNVLGSVGYYRQGPETGVNACINGFSDRVLGIADGFEEERKRANQRILARIREEGLSQMKMVQWFHAHDNYKGMSGKVVGSFCSYLRFQRFVNPVKYLLGMMNVPPDIPAWGRLPSSLVKVSGRAPQPLVGLIERRTKPPLSIILPKSCERIGGFGDGHSVAASGVFPEGAEDRFLDEIDRMAAGTGS